MNIKTSISIFAAALLLSACGSSSSSSDDSTSSSSSTTTSGVAIDGYIKDANVTVNGTQIATSGTNGVWSTTDTVSADAIIEISGGTDESTGEDFEGVLRTPYTSAPSIVATPLTTVIAGLMDANLSLDADAATTILADSLGIEAAELTVDPIVALASDDSNTSVKAASVIKNALLVQKMAEAFAKATSTDTDTQTANFKLVMAAVAASIKENGANGFAAATDATAISNEFADLNTTDATTKAKIVAAITTVESVAAAVATIDLTSNTDVNATTAIETASKNLQLSTSLLEASLADLAAATDDTVSSITITPVASTATATDVEDAVKAAESAAAMDYLTVDTNMTKFYASMLTDTNLTAIANSSITKLFKSGVTCDDNNALTENDVYTNIDGTCLGTVIPVDGSDDNATSSTPKITTSGTYTATNAADAYTITTGSALTAVINDFNVSNDTITFSGKAADTVSINSVDGYGGDFKFFTLNDDGTEVAVTIKGLTVTEEYNIEQNTSTIIK